MCDVRQEKKEYIMNICFINLALHMKGIFKIKSVLIIGLLCQPPEPMRGEACTYDLTLMR